MKVRKRVFLPHFILKMIFLPRQARDRHREKSKKKMAFRAARCLSRGRPDEECQQSNQACAVCFQNGISVLPRQALSPAQLKNVFQLANALAPMRLFVPVATGNYMRTYITHREFFSVVRNTPLFEEAFMYKNEHFTKTGSGQARES
jgi:hypothetical protein